MISKSTFKYRFQTFCGIAGNAFSKPVDQSTVEKKSAMLVGNSRSVEASALVLMDTFFVAKSANKMFWKVLAYLEVLFPVAPCNQPFLGTFCSVPLLYTISDATMDVDGPCAEAVESLSLA